MMSLNLGAGGRLIEGYVNVDRVQLPGIDVVHDLDVGPWPWADGTADEIRARDIFEHVDDPILFMTECHRILLPGGILWIRTPHISSRDSFTDPTHKRHCTEDTFNYWIPGNVYYVEHNAAYGGITFEGRSLTMDRGSMVVELVKLPRDETVEESSSM